MKRSTICTPCIFVFYLILNLVKETTSFAAIRIRQSNAIRYSRGPCLFVVGENDNPATDERRLETATTWSTWNLQSFGNQVAAELKEIGTCATIAAKALLFVSKNSSHATTAEILALCDELDALETNHALFVDRNLQLRRRAMEWHRYEWLASLLKQDPSAYVATATFLSPSRIPRNQLPNVQSVPITIVTTTLAVSSAAAAATAVSVHQLQDGLVADCQLDDVEYTDNVLDKTLLHVFRKLVTKHTGGIISDKPGMDGLLEQGRTYMLQPSVSQQDQHAMVSNTLGDLMTPVLPPVYRLFMSGIVFNKQLGPWFYAPFLTSIVTPPLFRFLVGPSRPNRRLDGAWGGLVVEKCRFLQLSNCKGLCLHQCKLPAQQFFANELGMPLTVAPNFETQECQWSFGQVPVPVQDDPSFPKGCLVGCQSRKLLGGAAAGQTSDLCSSL